MVGFATETGYLSGTGEKKPRIQTQAFITTGYGFWKLDTDIDPTFSLYNNRMIRSIRNTGPNLEGGYIFQQSKCCLHFKLCFFYNCTLLSFFFASFDIISFFYRIHLTAFQARKDVFLLFTPIRERKTENSKYYPFGQNT